MPDMSEILTWPQAIVALGILAVLYGIPEILRYKRDKRVEHIVSAVEHQVYPNSGKSLADSVNRIEKTVDKMDSRQDKMDKRQAVDNQRITRLEKKHERHWWSRS